MESDPVERDYSFLDEWYDDGAVRLAVNVTATVQKLSEGDGRTSADLERERAEDNTDGPE